MTDFDNVTINDTLTMKAPNQQDFINIKTVWVTYPTPGPILRISQGIWGMKDFSCLGFLGSVSKTVVTFGATYTNCVPSDIGKMVKDDGVDTSVLAYYNNEEKEWWLAGSTSIASGSAMTIVNGTGAGTSSGNSSTKGGGAIMMGHGLNDASDPPKISLIDSASGYATLHLRKVDGSPAHLDLGDLAAHGNISHEGSRNTNPSYTNEASNRANNTWYQNTSNKVKYITVYFQSPAGGMLGGLAYVGPSTSTNYVQDYVQVAVNAAQGAAHVGTLHMVVPPGYYYKVMIGSSGWFFGWGEAYLL